MLLEQVNQELLIGKLYERRVAETIAAELYDLAISCARAEGEDSALLAKFQAIQRQEQQHAGLIDDVLRRFGRDPDAPHPSAQLAQTELSGLLTVGRHMEARFLHLLQVLQAAELVDRAGWELLEELCVDAGVDDDVVRDFRAAGRHELEHLHVVTQRLEQAARAELTLSASPLHRP